MERRATVRWHSLEFDDRSATGRQPGLAGGGLESAALAEEKLRVQRCHITNGEPIRPYLSVFIKQLFFRIVSNCVNQGNTSPVRLLRVATVTV